MARIKRAQIRTTRKRNLFKRSKGFFMARGKLLRQTHEAVMHAMRDEFIGRKQKKRQFRRMWIVRISAALMTTDLSYSRFIHGLNLAGIDINRKMLSELAIHDRPAFDSIMAQAHALITERLAGLLRPAA